MTYHQLCDNRNLSSFSPLFFLSLVHLSITKVILSANLTSIFFLVLTEGFFFFLKVFSLVYWMKRGTENGECDDSGAIEHEIVRYKCTRVGKKEDGTDDEMICICVEHDIGSLSFGLSLWPAARALADFIVCHGSVFTERRVVELGAGTGLPGIVAARIHDADVLLTDVGNEVLDRCRSNIEFNGVESHCGVAEIDWSIPDAASNALRTRWPDGHGADVVIASDCIYDDNKSVHEDFVAVLAELLAPTECPKRSPVAYVAYYERNSDRSISHLLRLWGLQGRFVDERLIQDMEDSDDDCDEVMIRIIEITNQLTRM